MRLESAIGVRGCVQSLRVVESADSRLDVAAVRAVTDWRFRPATLDGAPVPVSMTISVQFTQQDAIVGRGPR